MFAKKLPELLKQIFPDFGGGSFSFGLSPKKNLIEPISSVGKPIGWLGKKAWKYSGGKKAFDYGKNKYENWKNIRKEEKQANKQIASDTKIYGKYGRNFENKEYDAVFGKDYADSLRAVKNAKSEMESALVSGGKNSQQYIDAKKKYDAAKEAHELRRKGNHELAAREDALKRYQLLHPTNSSRSNLTNSSRSNLTNSSQTSSNQQNNRQMTEGQRQQPVGKPPAQQPVSKPPVQQPQNKEFEYHPSKEWDERIEYATEKLQELANNGADQDEIENQIKILENLEKGKSHSVDIEKASEENADLADEEFRDSWASVGRADDSDN